MSAASSLPRDPSGSTARLRQLLSLSAVLSPLARQGALSRAGRLYPWIIAVGYAVLFAVSRGRDEVPAAPLMAAALGYMSFAGGAVAWGTATDRAPDERTLGLLAMASERGRSRRDQDLARWVSAMRVVARSVGAPGMCLALLLGTCADTGGHRAVTTLALVLAVGGYSALFGVVFGGLGRLAALVAPRHGHLLFALVVVGLYWIQSELGVPTLVSLFSTLLRHMATLGGAVG